MEFAACCEFYYGDVTFQEAFERTRKHVCISVSASTLGVKNPVSCLRMHGFVVPVYFLTHTVTPIPNTNRAAPAGSSSTT